MRIGITGHQRLRPGSRGWDWIEAAMRDVARDHAIGCAISALAAGVDQRFARIALELGATLEVIVPCRDYADVFGDRTAYQELLGSAALIDRLPFDQCDEQAYYAAGQVVVARCDLVLAVWDGQPAKGFGGTGDIVDYARAVGRPTIHIDPQRGIVRGR